jgi:hypothetical protein
MLLKLKKMKHLLLILFTVILGFSTNAQQTVYDIMDRDDLSIQQAEQMANAIFSVTGTGRGTGYKHFQRWLFERKFHTDETGHFIAPQAEWNNYLQSRGSLTNNITTAGNWTELGPVTWTRTSSWNPGTGRIAAMAINPSNESVIYAGSPGGGLWKTTNAGAAWLPLTDNNSTLMSIFAITIDPLNANIVYAGTSGSAGLIKSTDAGATWFATGSGPSGTIRKILIHASNTNIVFACATNGIFRSVNAGSTWVQVHGGSKEDIEFKPDDINIMYATGNDFYRSADNGVTWTLVGAPQGITNTGRTLVAVSAANPNYVYVAQAAGSLFGRMYKSTDAGASFVTTVVGSPASGTNYFGYETDGSGTTGQATYDMALDISPVNASEVYMAGIICWKSTNEGNSFFPLTAWSLPNSIGYNHADVHGLFWINSTIYSISDGGLFKSIDQGDNWTDLSAGLGIRQFYRFANSQTNANVITGGAQDNGSAARQASGNWVDWLGADGMEGLVSPTNHLNLWGTSQNGSLYKSTNGGNSYSNLPRPSAGQWVTPLSIHPTDETILYGGWTGVYKSTNSGSSWINISGSTITAALADLAVAPSNPNYIYASNLNTLYVTTDDGATWQTRSAPVNINDIWVDPVDPAKIWIAGNSTTNRIMVSTDAGATFTNISANLPGIVARSIVTDDNTPRGIYVGMNIGVYYQQEGAASWTNLSDNLPLVGINELEIQKAAGKLRVATYGRGVWESPVVTPIPPAGFTFNTPAPATAGCPAPAAISLTLGTNSINSFVNPITLSATAGVPPGTTITFATNPVTPGSSSIVSLNNANSLVAGNYVVTITGTATGATTQTRQITFTVTAGTGPVIAAQPGNVTACTGANTSFTVTSAGATSFQWQISTDGGSSYTNLSNGAIYSGATSATLTLTGLTAALNNNRYRCNAATTCGITNSGAGTLTLNTATAINTQPQNVTVCPGANTTFCVTATGSNLTYQWEYATACTAAFTNVAAGGNAACLNITNATSSGVYRCKVTGTCGTVTSACAELTAGSLVTVATSPVNKEVCSGNSTSFTVAGSSIQTIIYQWQVSTDGGTVWNSITGANSAALSLAALTATSNNNRYRCQLSNATCTTPANSLPAVLTVRQLPGVTLAAGTNNNLLPGQTTTLTATPTASTGGILTTSWFKDAAPLSNTGNTYTVNIEKTGSYQVKIQEAFTGGLVCASQSAEVVINAVASNKLFIFPSPNDGKFTLAYYNSAGTSTSRTIIVFDSKGGKVYNSTRAVTGAYTLLTVDIKPALSGIYFVVVSDANGKKMAEGKILVR